MALTTIKTGGLADNSVTNAKMADDAINSDDLADGSIDNVHLAGSIAVSKTLLSAGAGLTLSTNSLAVDADQSGQITQVGTLTSFRSTGIDDNADATAITIDSSENVGIGTASPDYLLEVESNNPVIALKETDTGKSWRLDLASSKISMVETGVAEVMTWDAGGSVGIGTTSPSTSLMVQNGTSIPEISLYHDSDANQGKGRIVFYTDINGSALGESGVKETQCYIELRQEGGTSRKGEIAFAVSDNGAPVEGAWFDNNCNLQFANGKGVQFSAKTPDGTSMSSEILDDYEEGTWTCTMTTTGTDFTTAGRGATGTYTKIGNIVTVFGDAYITSPSSGTGDFICTGLPFAPSDTRTYTSTSVHWGRVDLAGANSHYARCYGTGTNVLFSYSVNNANPSSMLASHLNGNTTPYLSFTMIYET